MNSQNKTFDKWSSLGYRIRKGEHSRFRNRAGIPLFTIDQVFIPHKSRRGISHSAFGWDHGAEIWGDDPMDEIFSIWDFGDN